MKPVCDTYERVIDYMRISVTDRCNLKCIYCMPPEGVRHIDPQDILADEEITKIVKIAARVGIRKIRITGGEPLFRKNLHLLIASLNKIQGVEDISITTNGLLLKRYAHRLAAAGLRRVNVSLDSLRPDRYRAITRGGNIRDVLEGIYEAEKAGLLPVKINMIPMQGVNDDEIENFALLTRYTSYQVRFIEFMPIMPQELWEEKRHVRTAEIMERVSSIAPIVPVRMRKSGPARYYRFESAPGVLGFISPITHHFCSSCNRVRLTADGKLRPCLFSEAEVDVKSPMRSGVADDVIEKLLRHSIKTKPEKHTIGSQRHFDYLRPMSRIGG